MPAPRLIIVSNRLPVTVSVDGEGTVVHASSGGLATGLRVPHQRSGGLWIGWPGDLTELSPDQFAQLESKLREMNVVPVALTRDEQRIYYEHICNGVIWPLCHDRVDQLPLHVDGWDVYEAVNQRFADLVVEHYRPGDMIWVHDYQLFRLPKLLRDKLPDAKIGFFLHIPFPNPEIFFALPTRRWLVEGIMGADLVGFHTRRYRGHFTAALRRLYGIEPKPDASVLWSDRRVALGIFPMGGDAAGIAERAAAPEIAAERAELRATAERLLIGIDRLDYSKGIPRRLLAFEKLLRTHPEWR